MVWAPFFMTNQEFLVHGESSTTSNARNLSQKHLWTITPCKHLSLEVFLTQQLRLHFQPKKIDLHKHDFLTSFTSAAEKYFKLRNFKQYPTPQPADPVEGYKWILIPMRRIVHLETWDGGNIISYQHEINILLCVGWNEVGRGVFLRFCCGWRSTGKENAKYVMVVS